MTRVFIAALLALPMVGCSVIPPQPLAHTPEFAPVYPRQVEAPQVATGAIYHRRLSDNMFGRGRTYQVGDVITVILNEFTQAARTQSSELNRKSSNDVVPKAVQNKFANMGGALGGTNVLGGSIANSGDGKTDQRATLEGSLAVTVVEVLPNGNLVIRGEKQLALAEGTEVIQVSGIIRPDDVAPNSTVQSRRLANAQISYRGTGDLAAATRPGWGTSLLFKLWPF